MLRDTAGATFEVVGGDLDVLRVSSGAREPEACDRAPTPPAQDEWAYWVGDTMLPMICRTDPEGGGPVDYTCRPVACASVSECPAATACGGGICRYVFGGHVAGHGQVDTLELVALCMAESPRTECILSDANFARTAQFVGSACSEESDLCSIPDECQPR